MSVAAASGRPDRQGVQASFDELGTPLREVTFVVVDLETTGGSPEGAGITEIGAVKVRGGEVLGEFQTLVNPSAGIPPFIQVLTGITDQMVASAPRLPAALPAFLEFARGTVLVAHNAPYDIGFLKAACTLTAYAWPGFAAVDTARLAHGLLTRDEVRDCRLATLARHFRTSTQPCHRALADARATVDVLHGLLERLGSLGVQSLEELTTFSSRVSQEQRRKRHLAEPLPRGPGVYLFIDARGEPLYVGKSRDVRSRVRQYFTATRGTSSWHWSGGSAGSPGSCGTRTPPCSATGWPRSPGRRPGPSGWPRSPVARSSSPPGRPARAAGSSPSSGTAGSPRPAAYPAARTRARTPTPSSPPQRRCVPAPARRRPRARRRPSASCAGWTRPAPGSWSSTARGRCPYTARRPCTHGWRAPRMPRRRR